MKKITAIILALAMIFCVAACQSDSSGGGDVVTATHALIDGKSAVTIDGSTELTAEADIPDGMAVDYWELNGQALYEETGASFTFTAEGNTAVGAVLRPECKVTAVNAQLQFLNDDAKPAGEAFTEFVFEDDYENPVTGQTLAGGLITVYVKAVVPSGYALDYWTINGVPYYYGSTVTAFTVQELDEATVYEAVLREVSAPVTVPKPVATPAPTAKPATTPAPTPVPTPEPTPEPVTYYSVSCTGCTFSGGGYSGATSGSVPAGTTITVTSTVSYSNTWYWTGSITDGNNFNGGGAASHTYTVNSDCIFECKGIVN